MSDEAQQSHEAINDARIKRVGRVATVASMVGSILTVCGVIMPIAWKTWLGPLLVAAVVNDVQAQMQQQVDMTVASKVAPLNAGFKIILQQQISSLERDIDRLEFEQRDSQRPSSATVWTIEKVNALRDKTNTLLATRAALAAIEAEERRQ